MIKKTLFIAIVSFTFSCSKDTTEEYVTVETYPNITATFGTKINVSSLENYANQTVPNYITKNNSFANAITDKGATLGRVCFMIKNYLQTTLFLVQVAISRPMLLVILLWQVKV